MTPLVMRLTMILCVWGFIVLAVGAASHNSIVSNIGVGMMSLSALIGITACIWEEFS